MILSIHIITGSLIATATENWWLGGLAAFASHYILDAIPHWDYPTTSLRIAKGSGQKFLFLKNKSFWQDFLKPVLDIACGLIILFLLINFKNLNYYQALAGAFLAASPDLLQLLSWTLHIPFLKYHDKFQYFTHSKKELSAISGLFIQILVAVLAIVIF